MMGGEKLLTTDELEAGLDEIRQSPKDAGVLKLIVRRPKPGEREVVSEAELDLVHGLVGDNWMTRGSRLTRDGSSHPDMQLTVMNARAIALLAQQQDRWKLAGDQLYVDMDLSVKNLPSGTKLTVGTAVIEVTDQPHTGCKQFTARFGRDATNFVNSAEGKQLRLRGINAKVVRPGIVRIGDIATTLQGGGLATGRRWQDECR
jgi:MOSC domain-containing protein